MTTTITLPERLVEQVNFALHAVMDFTAVLGQETAALRGSDFPLFQALQDEKLVRAQNYQDSILALEEFIEFLPSLDDATKTALRTAQKDFSKAAADNQTLLEAKLNSSERIVNLIMDAARRTVSDGPAYGANGVQDISDKIPVHFKLNEVL